ncbi:MAG: HEAT repeat domain-containing protein [Planctomycetes bacterium]|nr:HEAT repeat domain-containing protein [Planctomycetota bacterium]
MELIEIALNDPLALMDELQYTNDSVARQHLVYALGKNKDHRVFLVLRDEVGSRDPAVREVAAWALGENGDPEAIGILRHSALTDPEERVRKAAITGLGTNGGMGAREALISMITYGPPTETLRSEAYESIGKLQDAESISYLQEALLREPDFLSRHRIIYALRFYGKSEETATMLESVALDLDSDPSTIHSALSAIGEIRGPDAALGVYESLLDRASGSKAYGALLESIGLLHSDRAHDLVLSLAESPDRETRVPALAALGTGGDWDWEKVKSILTSALASSRDTDERSVALATLTARNLTISPALVESLLVDPEAEIRAGAVPMYALVTAGLETGRLKRILREEASTQVRRSAIGTLGTIGYYVGPERVTRILEIALQTDPDPEVREAAGRALERAREYSPDNLESFQAAPVKK